MKAKKKKTALEALGGLKKCKYCLSEKNLTIDHKIPLSKGGTDNVKNLQCLCFRCNTRKGGLTDKQVKDLFQWLYDINHERLLKGKKYFGEKQYLKRHPIE